VTTPEKKKQRSQQNPGAEAHEPGYPWPNEHSAKLYRICRLDELKLTFNGTEFHSRCLGLFL